jgi:hypothetical protein
MHRLLMRLESDLPYICDGATNDKISTIHVPIYFQKSSNDMKNLNVIPLTVVPGKRIQHAAQESPLLDLPCT